MVVVTMMVHHGGGGVVWCGGGVQLGEGSVVEKEETAMLVPLGSFNPVPKILSAIQSDDLEDERAALQSDCDSMDQAMQIIVDGTVSASRRPFSVPTPTRGVSVPH